MGQVPYQFVVLPGADPLAELVTATSEAIGLSVQLSAFFTCRM